MQRSRSRTCCRSAAMLQSTKLPQVAATDCVRFRPIYLRHIGIPARRCWTRTSSQMGTDTCLCSFPSQCLMHCPLAAVVGQIADSIGRVGAAFELVVELLPCGIAYRGGHQRGVFLVQVVRLQVSGRPATAAGRLWQRSSPRAAAHGIRRPAVRTSVSSWALRPGLAVGPGSVTSVSAGWSTVPKRPPAGSGLVRVARSGYA